MESKKRSEALALPGISANSLQIRRVFRRSLLIWGLIVIGGVCAYGLGLYQGSQYRMQRSTAAQSEP